MIALSEIWSTEILKLDGRSIEQRLQEFYDYVRLIPFAENPGKYWSDFFFPDVNNDLPQMAMLYRDPLRGDGNVLPQQAFLLTFLRQLETPTDFFNHLPVLHRQLYYRDLLGMQPRAAQPDQVVLSFRMATDTAEQLLPAGLALDAGQDSQGRALHYVLDQPLQVNAGQLHEIRWLRPDLEGQYSMLVQSGDAPTLPQQGLRLFAPHAQEQRVTTGRLVAAEVLALSGGVRTITVSFETPPAAGTLGLALSGEAGWLVQSEVQVDGNEDNLVFSVGADQPAITAPNGLDGFNDAAPLLKITRQDGKDIPAMTQIAVEVTATESSQLVLRTQTGVSNWYQELTPFGSVPVPGAAIALMAADWLGTTQPVTITLTPQWRDLPEQSFATWYANYPSAGKITDNGIFRVEAEAFGAQGWVKLGDAMPLFVGGSGAPQGLGLHFSVSNLPGAPVDSSDPGEWASRVRLTLTDQDFLHQEYWQQMDAGLVFDDQGRPRLNQPYTPQWEGLEIRYASTQEVSPEQQTLLTPFGHQVATATLEAATVPQLYLGFAGMQAGQYLSLYWTLRSPLSLSLQWEYLDGSNQWQSLDAQVFDGTGGWFESGLWSAILPADASDQAPWMPSGYHWLRASVAVPGEMAAFAAQADAEHISNYPLLQGLLANCMTATLDTPEQVAGEHFAQPLPPDSITQTVVQIAALDAVLQPWPSQGGRAQESLAAFSTRVAQHLSSRGRALRQEDLKSMLLEHFSEVYAVIIRVDGELPGQQIITVIPAPGFRDNTDAVRPVFNPARLQRMRHYLQQHTSPWATLIVNNPSYIDVAVYYEVEFDPVISEAFGLAQLDMALALHYQPWASDAEMPVNTGKQIDYYQLLAFIQQQPFVTKVNRLFLNGNMQSVMAGINEVLVLQWEGAVGVAPPSPPPPPPPEIELPLELNLRLSALGEKQLQLEWDADPQASYYECFAGDHLLGATVETSYFVFLTQAWQYPVGTVFSVHAIVEVAAVEEYAALGTSAATLTQVHLRDLSTRLLPADVTSADEFGQSLAFNAAGDTLFIGAPGHQNGLGAVYEFKRSETGWHQESKLLGQIAGSHFGHQIRLLADGVQLIVSAPVTSDGGRVYIWGQDTPGTWNVLSDFGHSGMSSTAMYGADFAVVYNASQLWIGAPGYNGGEGNVWNHALSALSALSAVPPVLTQAPVATDSGTDPAVDASVPMADVQTARGLVVSASPNTLMQAYSQWINGLGVIRLYHFVDGAYQLIQELSGPLEAAGQFGRAVSFDGDGSTLIVGAPDTATTGRLCCYTFSGETYLEQGIYGNFIASHAGDQFGASVAINDAGDVIATHSVLGNDEGGGVQIFKRSDDGGWQGWAHLGCYFSTRMLALDHSGRTLAVREAGDENFGVYIY